ncbi:MAG: adenylosuccinate synthetase [Clostridiales bacterium]|nr:adenylosuccinate synthetase [Clostridiales bacterium]
MNIKAVIGKNFGDEGKGLATDYLAMCSERSGRSCIVVRHNGGAQAGHTVEALGKRFIFHELSSGSFRGADTFWAPTFMPDLYKLSEERDSLAALGVAVPKILSAPDCPLTYIDDILINMSLETRRGKYRHGSCGMGIDEAKRRSLIPEFKITPLEVVSGGAEAFYKKLLSIRSEYLPERLAALSLDPSAMGEYGDLIIDKNVLYNFCERMCRNSELITIAGESVIRAYDDVIFEGAQGLILDEENNAFAPNLTSSRTGLTNPDAMLSRLGINEPCEAVYVTRTYVTKHGAGRFPYEEIFLAQGRVFADETNIRNEWQGSLRFAPHGDEDEFNEYVIRDVDGSFFSPSVMFTHVDETDGKVLTVDGDVLLDEWVGKVNKGGLYRKVYVSASHFAEDITLMK